MEFETFYLKHYQFVFSICYTYMKNRHEAEDVTEDIFVKVYTSKICFENEEHEKSWLAVATINLCKDRLKSWWKRKISSLELQEEIPVNDEIKTDDTLNEVMKLPSKYKDVVYLYYYMGYSTDEIAVMLKKPASTIRNHLREARLKLKDVLEGEV